jgi:hypothetical protein
MEKIRDETIELEIQKGKKKKNSEKGKTQKRTNRIEKTNKRKSLPCPFAA